MTTTPRLLMRLEGGYKTRWDLVPEILGLFVDPEIRSEPTYLAFASDLTDRSTVTVSRLLLLDPCSTDRKISFLSLFVKPFDSLDVSANAPNETLIGRSSM